MTLKIRLRKQGRKNHPFFRVVVADSRFPRDGKYVECIGWYNPFESEQGKGLKLDEGRVVHWLERGVQLSENAEALVAREFPAVMKNHRDKQMAHRTKMTAKKREARRKKAAAK
ncbi:MAG: 30S ribosomal protein S16 [Chlamydiae bacterium]|nr:30S ribosomal protein S16 [Chlamydiota bacterium]